MLDGSVFTHGQPMRVALAAILDDPSDLTAARGQFRPFRQLPGQARFIDLTLPSRQAASAKNPADCFRVTDSPIAAAMTVWLGAVAVGVQSDPVLVELVSRD